ncbi:MAG: hypothetical protein RLZZ379_1450 [Pseudomonadota bacterium]
MTETDVGENQNSKNKGKKKGKKGNKKGKGQDEDEDEEVVVDEDTAAQKGYDGFTAPSMFYSHRVIPEILYPTKQNPRSRENTQFSHLMDADKIAWNSLIMLPQQAILKSAVHLGTTSIYDRANFSNNGYSDNNKPNTDQPSEYI